MRNSLFATMRSVYMSAGQLLKQDFRGKRLDTVLKKHPQAMTNLWPYLRYRQREVADRQKIYAASFLPRALKLQGRNIPISPRLWGSPDHDRQLCMALRYVGEASTALVAAPSLCLQLGRFVMTRFWFALSLGGDGSEDWQQEIVLDAQETVPDEIWSISIHSVENAAASVKTLYVLEATCEVVGHPPAPRKPDASMEASRSSASGLRADWSAYIQKCLPGRPSSSSTSIFSHLKWANYAEYEQGVSRLWLRRVSNAGDVDMAKRAVARRYVLACVVGNRYGQALGSYDCSLIYPRAASVAAGRLPRRWRRTSLVYRTRARRQRLFARLRRTV